MKSPAILMLATVCLTLLAGGAGLAHEGASGVVKERMEAMKGMATAMKALAPMMQGKTGYDAVRVSAAAAVIKSHAEEIPALFPKGSNGHPSEARATVWSDWPDFERQARILGAYAAALEAMAGMGAGAAMQDVRGSHGQASHEKKTADGMPHPDHLRMMTPNMLFAAIGKSCKGCHQDFREKKN